MTSSKLHRVGFQPDAEGPLKGLRVVDLSRLVCGNMLTHQLADFGAEVIKVEPVGKGDPLRAWSDGGVETQWKVYGRGKKSLALNLREPAAIEAVRKLAATAQVFVEGFRPGRLEDMGLGPDVLLALNPKLVICRISGFGQTGPYRDWPGFGSMIEAMSGFADRNGFPDREPVLPPFAMADMVAGLQGAYAVMVAVRQVETNGGAGQVIDLALWEPLYSALGPEALVYQVTGKSRQRRGSRSNTSSPRNVYGTQDGKWIALSGSIQSMAERVFRVIGRADMINDPRFRTNADRLAHREIVDAAVGEWVGGKTLADVMAVFEREGITASPVYDQGDILEDPHVIGREVVVEVPDPDLGQAAMHNVTPRLSETPGALRGPAPRLGEHTAALMDELGYDAEMIKTLRQQGVLEG